MRFLTAALKVVAAIAGLLVIVAFSALAWIRLLKILQRIHDMPISGGTVSAALMIVILVLLLMLLGAVAFTMWVALRGLWSVKTLFGASPWARLVGLGVVALFFPRALYSFVSAPLWFVVDLLWSTPKILEQWSFIAKEDKDAYPLKDVFGKLAITLQSISREVSEVLSRFIEALPIVDLALAFALWALIGNVLSTTPVVAGEGGESGPGRSRIEVFFRKLTHYQRYRLFIGVILLLSAFLSIAAIVAIPWLKPIGSTEPLNKERLTSILQNQILDQPTFDSQYKERLEAGENVFAELQNVIKQAEKSATKLDSNRSTNKYAEYLRKGIKDSNEFISAAKQAREQITKNWENLRKQVRLAEGRNLKAAVGGFETEMYSPMAIRERQVYFQDLERWFGNTIEQLHGNLRQCMDWVQAWNTVLLPSAARDRVRALQKDIEVATGASAKGEDLPSYDSLRGVEQQSLLMGYSMSSKSCTMTSLEAMRPQPPDPGLGLGPFGIVSRWLLRTKSPALALITGMLGFGLLGAAISSFIRKGLTPDAEQVQLDDLLGMVVRGLSAAVIVFLAVTGGLAAFATGETQPNAYVLFFTCLVGAVFSERVWKWARERLEGQLGGADDVANSKASTGGNPRNTPGT